MTRERTGFRGGWAVDPGGRGVVPLTVFCASLLLIGVGWLFYDRSPIRPDSHKFFSAGQMFMDWILTGTPDWQTIKSHKLFPHYFISSALIASIASTLDAARIGAAALNSILFSLVVTLMYQFWTAIHGTWHRWTGRQGLVIAVAGGLYILFGLPDAFLWSYTVLTDVIFLFWVAVFLVSTVRGILSGGRTAWLIACIMAVTAPFVRPTGLLVPLLLLYGFAVKALIESDIRTRTISAVSIAVPVAVAFLLVPLMVSMKINGHPWVDAVIPGALQGHFEQAVYFFRNGIVVSNRLESYVEAPQGYMDVLGMIVTRLTYYWIPLRFGDAPYSLAHNAVNLVYVAIAWPLLFIGVRRLIRVNRRFQLLVLFLLMVSLSYALMHAATLVSFSWRYQVPAMVPLWMLAGAGLFTVLGYPVRPDARAAG